MELLINGERRTVQAGTVAELLGDYGLAGRPVIVELNGTIVAKDSWDSVRLENGAKLEIVQFIGGG